MKKLYLTLARSYNAVSPQKQRLFILGGMLIPPLLFVCLMPDEWISTTLQFIKRAVIILLNYSDIFPFHYDNFLYYLGSAVIAFAIELIIVGYEKSTLRRMLQFKDHSLRLDVYSWFLHTFNIAQLFSIIFTLGISYKLYYVLKTKYHFDVAYLLPGEFLQFIVVFILFDLRNYWFHWLLHKYPFFWELHRYHHSATDFTFFTTERRHFVHDAFNYLFAIPIIVIFGSPVDELFYIFFMERVHQYMLHSRFDWGWGWVGKYILVSPAVHRTHHALDKPKYYGKNLGVIFIFWDHLFGTYVEPEKIERLGVDDDDINDKNHLHGMIHTYRRALKTLRPFKRNTSLT